MRWLRAERKVVPGGSRAAVYRRIPITITTPRDLLTRNHPTVSSGFDGHPSRQLTTGQAATEGAKGCNSRRGRVDCASATKETAAEISKQSDSQKAVLTLPTILTLARVVAIPVLIAVWFGKDDVAATWTGAIFLVACITDFFDGFLARKMGTFSAFGAFLDPVADKLMVSTVLILLSSRPLLAGPLAGNSWLMPTLSSAIIGREIAMSALREWAASVSQEAHKAAAVSQLGKWKTTTQMVALTLLLFTSRGADNRWLQTSASLGTPLLGVAAFLTVFSLYEYMRGLWKYLFGVRVAASSLP